MCSITEKQYDRRQLSTHARSAKSEDVKRINFSLKQEFILLPLKIFRLIDRRLQTGVYGVRHMFRSNDPNQEGKLSKYRNRNGFFRSSFVNCI